MTVAITLMTHGSTTPVLRTATLGLDRFKWPADQTIDSRNPKSGITAIINSHIRGITHYDGKILSSSLTVLRFTFNFNPCHPLQISIIIWRIGHSHSVHLKYSNFGLFLAQIDTKKKKSGKVEFTVRVEPYK